MVAIVAGNGLGLFNTSGNILGSVGVLGQGWLGQAGGRWDGERTVVLTGTRNATGSKVTRTAGDGSVTDYTWNGSRYVSHDGDGADDSFQFDTGTSQWVFTDGSTQREERYSGAATAANPARR